MPKKKIVVPQVVIEKKPKVKYVSKLKEYSVNFDATIKVHQEGFESILPWCIKEDKSKFVNLTKEQIVAKVKEAIRECWNGSDEKKFEEGTAEYLVRLTR